MNKIKILRLNNKKNVKNEERKKQYNQTISSLTEHDGVAVNHSIHWIKGQALFISSKN